MPRLHIITNRFPATPDDQASPFVRDFAQAVAARGVDVDVSTPAYNERREEPDRLTLNWLPWRGTKEVIGASSPFNPFDMLAVARFARAARSRILETLESRPADHCLALWALPSGWFALQAKKRLGVPYSVWCLGSDIYVWARRPLLGRITREVLSGAKALYADGEDLCEAVRGLAGRECRFLPSLRLLPGASSGQTAEGEAVDRGAVGGGRDVFSRGDLRLAYVGRLDAAKGVFVALDALAAVRIQNPRVSLSLLGWGPDESNMKSRCRELGIESAVYFRGKGGPAQVAAIMRECDCLLIPSLGDSIPLVFGEALQMGIPLIVTDVGDMGRLTRNNGLGTVVSPGSVAELADAISSMASNGPPDGYRDRMRQLLRRFHPNVAAESFLSATFGEGQTS